MFIADALRTLPGLGKAFAPGDIPMGEGLGTASQYLALPREGDPARTIGDGQGTSIVQLVINWYFNTFPEAVLTTYGRDREGTEEELLDHDLTELMENPNPYYGQDELNAGFIVSDIVDGNSYFLKLRNGAGRVVEFWWVPHTIIEPKGSQDPFGPFIEYYEYKVNGMRYPIPITEIVHIRHGIDPANPRKGMSRLKGQLREIMTDEEAARFTSALVVNMGVPGLVVSPKDSTVTIGPDDAQLIKAKLNQTTTGSERGRTVVIHGATDINQFGFNPQEMNLSAIRAVPEERLSAALGVPAAVAGLGTGLAQTKVGATMHELREMATEQGLVPMWRRHAKGLTRGLAHEFSGGQNIRVGYDTSGVRVLQEDRNKLHERTRQDVTAGVVDVATGQATMGYPVDEAQRVYLRSAVMVEVPVGMGSRPVSPDDEDDE